MKSEENKLQTFTCTVDSDDTTAVPGQRPADRPRAINSGAPYNAPTVQFFDCEAEMLPQEPLAAPRPKGTSRDEIVFVAALEGFHRGKSGSVEKLKEVAHRFLNSRRGQWLREGADRGGIDEDEVVSDVIQSLASNLKSFRGDDLRSWHRWLTVLVRRKMLDIYRKQIRCRTPSLKEAAAADQKSAVKSAIASEHLERLQRALAELPSQYRDIVVLRLSGATLSEIADLIDEPIDASASRMYQILDYCI